MPRLTSNVATTALTATVTLAMAAPAAAIDPVVGFWNAPNDFGYSVSWMPDIDQSWGSLPNNGNMHCAPTACMNMLAFAAHWGVPTMDPGAGVWENDTIGEQLDLADAIGDLGFLMGTGDGGTGLTGTFTGLDLWIGDRPFDVFVTGRTENDFPTLSDVADFGSAGGGTLISIGYGRYDWTQQVNGVRLLTRNTGHRVTVQQATRDGWDESLIVRDPAGGGNLWNQSAYSSRVFGTVETREVIYDRNGDGIDGTPFATMLGVQNNGVMRVMDSITCVAPSFAAGFEGGSVAIDIVGGITSFDGPGGGQQWSIDLPQGFEPIELTLAPGPFQPVVLARAADGRFSQLVMKRGRLDAFAEPLMLPLDDVSAIHVDRHGRTLLASGRQLFELGPIDPATGEPQLVELLVAGHEIGTLAYDEPNDRVLLTAPSGPQATIVDLTPGIEPEPIALLLPAVQAAREAARRQQTERSDSSTFVIVDETAAIDALLIINTLNDSATLESRLDIEAGRRVDSATIDRRGHLVIQYDDGEIETRTHEGHEQWIPIESIHYGTTRARSGLVLSSSRSNLLPGVHDGPEWNDMPADEVEFDVTFVDCPADFDGDGMVGFGDLTFLLAEWGPGGAADIMPAPGGDGIVDFNDLVSLLAAWGDCG